MEYLEQFTVIDKNRDGIISRRDLFKYALSIGEDLSMVDGVDDIVYEKQALLKHISD
ncbi:hypothetical protein Smp_133640 [Schistosoma mansoni]|uniref:hypothetical protein n=1 Tax=Schistosoma mansoni TaxID=6183 RepID=UPI0001A63709|nr:hypothetical protein Smp_133640 [Schistosoma mansoni]|eukprot:XP_018650556.1 hypothetical protein Smp_133640 [Schistosoma mansoni]